MEESEIKFVQKDLFMSDSINELATSLAKAEADIKAVHKEEEGYGYNYASLASTIETIKEPLKKNNLAVTQLLGKIHDGKATLTTMLLHSSGQYLGSTADITIIDMKGCNAAQGQGASVSYLRRYALQAILNMASEDNDASSGQVQNKPKEEPASKPKGGFGRSAKIGG